MKVKTLKLIRNKLTDDNLMMIFALIAKNQTIRSVNLAYNLITEKGLDVIKKCFS